jgi:hypothetical protein
MFISRSDRRFAINAHVSFKPDDNDAKTVEGKVVDLSLSGCCLILKEDIAVNTIIDFDFRVEFLNQHLTGKGKIVHIRTPKTPVDDGFRTGVSFIQADKLVIADYINISQRLLLDEKKRLEAARKRKRECKDPGPF